MFHSSQNDEYFQMIVNRAKNEYLVWVEQFLDLIESHVNFESKTLRLNDIGCNVGQFYKGLKRRNLPIEYAGYDIEPKYLQAAAELFPDISGKLLQLDITEQKTHSCQISVVSAVLEHLRFLSPGLDHILQSTEVLLLIRTFLGENEDKSIFLKRGASVPYYINQFSFTGFLDLIHQYGFETNVIRDRYTDSMPKYLGQGIVRTQYVIVGKKVE